MMSLSISRQIYLAVGFVLALLAVLALMSYLATVKLAGIFDEYKATARQTLLANELFEGLFQTQFATFNYSLAPSDQVAQEIWDHVDEIADSQRSAEQIFAGDAETRHRLGRIERAITDYRHAFSRITEFKARSDALDTRLADIDADIRKNLTAVVDLAYERGDGRVSHDAAAAQQDFNHGRLKQERYLFTHEPRTFETAMAAVEEARSRVEALQGIVDDPEILLLAQDAEASLSAYQEAARRNYNLISLRNTFRDQKLERLSPLIKKELEELVDTVVSRQAALDLDVSSRTEATVFLLAALSASAVALGLGLAAFVTRRISGSVSAMADSMSELAAGDLDIDLPCTEQQHEIGRMARALEVFKTNAQEVKRTLEKERELNGLQRQFVSMVSHEFRTPLAIIDGHAQRLERRPDRLTSDRVLATIGVMRRSVLRLIELMESVLSAARMEEGKIQYQPALFDFADMVREISGSYADINPKHRIDVDLGDLPRSAYGDVKLLRQVVSNLLSNAVKYSPEDTSVFVRGASTEDGGVRISVRDQGVGIPADELERLTERFFRASTSTGISGTGIGLYLVQQLIELHGGKVNVKSEVGQGTTFEIWLPGQPREAERPSAADDDQPPHPQTPALVDPQAA